MFSKFEEFLILKEVLRSIILLCKTSFFCFLFVFFWSVLTETAHFLAAEVGFLNLIGGGQLGTRTGKYDTAGLEDVGAIAYC